MDLSPTLKGMLGENEVESVVKALTRVYNLKYLTDVVLPSGNSVTQIDLVIFSTKIFICLEIKTWDGVITLPYNLRDGWKISYKTKVINVFSPVVQNTRHTIALNNNSPNGIKYNNYVVFPTNPVIINKHGNVGDISDLVNLIGRRNDVYSQDIVDMEYDYFKKLSDSYFQDYIIRELSRNINIETNLFGD